MSIEDRDMDIMKDKAEAFDWLSCREHQTGTDCDMFYLEIIDDERIIYGKDLLDCITQAMQTNQD